MTIPQLSLDELTGENRVLEGEILRLESNLKALKLWKQQNDKEIGQQLGHMSHETTTKAADCTLCMGYCV